MTSIGISEIIKTARINRIAAQTGKTETAAMKAEKQAAENARRERYDRVMSSCENRTPKGKIFHDKSAEQKSVLFRLLCPGGLQHDWVELENKVINPFFRKIFKIGD